MNRTPQTVNVKLNDTLVGELIFETKGDKQGSAFRYDNAWLRDGFALDPHLPLTAGWHHHWSRPGDTRSALPSAIADCAPDAWGRKLMTAQLGRAPTELEALLSVNDTTRLGALRFVDKGNRALGHEPTATPAEGELSDIQRLCQLVETGALSDAANAARALCGRGDSLGGARPKSDCVDATSTLHLAKFMTSRDTSPVTRLEVATLQLAKDVGLRAADARLVGPHDPFPIALVKRFDRQGQLRIPYISAKSFIGEGTFYSEIAEQLIETSTGSFLSEANELYERVAFTILVKNTDDHLHNHGLLRVGNEWVLSPVFDVNPQPTRHPQLKTGIHPSVGFVPSVEALVELADAFIIDRTSAAKRVAKMARTLQTQWRVRCAQYGMTPKEIASFAPAFEHRELNTAIGFERVASQRR